MKSSSGWTKIVLDHLPICFVERVMTRKNTNLSPIDSDTVVKYIDKLVIAVEEKIKEELFNQIGIIFDGWSDQTSTHYVSLTPYFRYS